MSCQKNCPHVGRRIRVPRHRLDAARRKLEFSDEISETVSPPMPANKYEYFKKVSENHSSHKLEPPMYSSAEMAAVPESFLAAFGGRADIGTGAGVQKKVASPLCQPCEESPEIEIPESFLEFCQERQVNQPAPAKTPPRKPTTHSSYYAQGTPYNTSYYGYEDPGVQHGMIFHPRVASTPCPPRKATPAPPHPGYYYPPPFTYYTRAASYMESQPSPAPPAGVIGLGKYAYPATHVTPTPPTPSWLCAGACAKSGTFDESTVSSGDLLGSSSRRQSSSRRSRSANIDEAIGAPLAQSAPISNQIENYRYPTPSPGAIGIGKYAYPPSHSPTPTPPTPSWLCGGACAKSAILDESSVSSGDLLGGSSRKHQSIPMNSQFNYELSNVRKPVSVSSIPDTRGNLKCPILGVTPVHSSVSLSDGGNLSGGNRQNIRQSIENELRTREIQEKNQLETDLIRWQQARRRLVMDTASMGA